MLKKIISLLLLSVAISTPVYGHDLSQIGLNLPCTNVNVIKSIVMRNLTDSDYGGIYTAMDGLHIVPIDTALIETEVARAEIEMQCFELPIVIDSVAKYSVQDLLDAQDKLDIFFETGEIQQSYVRSKYNDILVSAKVWTEDKKQRIRDIAGIDNITFKIYEVKTQPTIIEEDYSLLPIQESYADEKEYMFQPMDEDTKLKIMAGKLWINRKKFYISSIDVSSMPIVVDVVDLTPKKESAIRAFAGVYADKIHINSVDKVAPSDYVSSTTIRKLAVSADKNYVVYDDMLFVIKNKPYMKDGYLMLPIRDLYGILEQVSDLPIKFTIDWIGGEAQIVELSGNYNAMPVQLSITDNLLIWSAPTYKNSMTQMLEGTAEMINGSVFIPYSRENTSFFLDATPNDIWDKETQTLTLQR